MTGRKRQRNLAASVHQRLLTIARERRDELQSVLARYGVERLLYRLGESPAQERFVLKGAVLFTLWDGSPHRPTRDVDFLAYGDSSPDAVAGAFRELCTADVEPDGLTFLADTVKAEPIRDRQEYGGVRVTLLVTLGAARIPMQIDVGFGDAVTPPATISAFPTLLDFPAPRVRAYSSETVVAEKAEAMVSLGIVNTRMKDFYDLWLLAGTRAFDGAILGRAIDATFSRRGTPIPTGIPVAFGEAFSRDRERQAQWAAFLSRARLTGAPRELAATVERIREFIFPLIDALSREDDFCLKWTPTAGWR